MTTLRNTAVEAARSLNQEIFEALYDPLNCAWYVHRDGTINHYIYEGDYFELQSVYFGDDDAPVRVLKTGLDRCGYSGPEYDYRELVPLADQGDRAPGKYFGQYATDEFGDVDSSVCWDGNEWCEFGAILNWQNVKDEEPCQPILDVIEALPLGFFDDEAASLEEAGV